MNSSISRPVIPLLRVMLYNLGLFGVQFVVMIIAISTPLYVGDFSATIELQNYIWFMIPLIGMVIQPVIGFLGDNLWNSLGRRGGVIAIMGTIGAVSLLFLGYTDEPITILILSSLVLITVNALFVSYRALVCEITPPKQRVSSYAIFSLLQLGAIVAAIMVRVWLKNDEMWVDINEQSPISFFTPTIMIIGAVVMIVTTLLGLTFLKEYKSLGNSTMSDFVEFQHKSEAEIIDEDRVSYMRSGAMYLSVTVITLMIFSVLNFSMTSYVIPVMMLFFALFLMAAHKINMLKEDRMNSSLRLFVELIEDIMNMPRLMKKVSVVMFLVWFAIFTFLANLEGIIMQDRYLAHYLSFSGGWDSVTNCYLIIALIAFVYTPINILYGAKSSLHSQIIIVTVLATLSLFLFYLVGSGLLFIVLLVMIGLLLSVIITLPYAMVSYVLPTRRVGVFMGLLSVFIFTPYILTPEITKSYVLIMYGLHINTVLLSVISLMLSLIVCLMITDRDYVKNG